ncbi:MAG: glucokinase [Proteobacteria bacterium]|nr:glucokinase [Pseudomonadota bacterium]
MLIIPGTGVGVAAVIAGRPDNKQSAPVCVSCELQHTAIPILNSEHQQILNILKDKLGKTRPSWEDFISGKGLENIHDALMRISNDAGNTINGLPANEIAERAVQKSDTRCQAAMDMFYRCVGALAQVLALTFQPYGGIYLAGESSRKNSLFIPQSPLLTELHNNPVRYDLLQAFPVYLVPADINLDGAAYIASQQLSRLNDSD